MGEYTMTRTDLQLQAAAKVERAAALIRELTEAGCQLIGMTWYKDKDDFEIHCCLHRDEKAYCRWAADHGSVVAYEPDRRLYQYVISCVIDGIKVFALATEEEAKWYDEIRDGGQE